MLTAAAALSSMTFNSTHFKTRKDAASLEFSHSTVQA